MRTRIKICGITRVEDAADAVRHGVDAIGLVFYPSSPRAISLRQAQAIVKTLPPFITVVGLFVDEARSQIERFIREVPIDLLQFHGHETAADCSGYGLPWIKAVRMRDEIDLAIVERDFSHASGLLLDSYQAGVPGGTGQRFDWSRISPTLASKVILAGGLNLQNVVQAIRQVHPYAVDVSGGIEVSKGVKDAAKIEAFIAGVKRGDN
ncbi:MAG: phosphoribosylanthranilate isomerase [Candidatus Thiodiazotropha sp. (ex Lucinoma aequizonata)]|nr:phosphoribosylanthranilate isomerase [Candidatus Thiodiazotropha sp. (ex Lucinoma aequizonata)]MCU7889146.1 phosphoribosylanthranilate isomerase [Candidatus Thiodiazotropha sp. (ex Lucinoma aequizonata)]MCU7893871.1 phosphoribosylanthranilate isomerase [Candidatus Thiodiazotropha sp. (ex Lucinoma aequizonata)]MCU7899020.1 phosphoribosylanthranilate isomerase [Candidatus Thiodiazotropha sp. (ex Lucinoma aequizonata)]MCU7901851.1 phosphoribosylanthranilate isomerase [Candidatus Thiodiazotropha